MTAKHTVTTTPLAGDALPDELDADAPLTENEFQRGHTAMLARRARATTGLSQQAFAERYGIPAASLREIGSRAVESPQRGAKLPAGHRHHAHPNGPHSDLFP